MIRQRLRQIGRFLIELRCINDKITDLFSVFNPEYFDSCKSAIISLAGLNEYGTGFKTPSLATSLGTLLRQLCRRCITLMIKRQNKKNRKDAENFLKLLTEDYSSISRIAVETQLRKKRQKIKLLPTQKDIQKLEVYLDKKMTMSFLSLKENFSLSNWTTLAECCLILLQIFNRRRSGEIERVLLEDFKNYHKVSEETIGEEYKTLNKKQKLAAQKYVRFTIRGKLGRIVSVLVHTQIVSNLELFLSYRDSAKVNPKNPYLFGMPGTLKGDYRYLRACDLIRKFSEQCGAVNPLSLRGTNLRKQIATACEGLNLRDDKVSDLANFMGHADKIHKEHYRQPILSREILKISKLLEIVRGKDDEEEENVENDIESETAVEMEETSTEVKEYCSINRKRKKDLTHDSVFTPDAISENDLTFDKETSSSSVSQHKKKETFNITVWKM
ncbi:uncharacterized protein [Prorops nasuta]|uniref:uncharacterized protein n=1 Tax=Prorops nasuta TaxID=863751 RepID=UPI0034CE28B0